MTQTLRTEMDEVVLATTLNKTGSALREAQHHLVNEKNALMGMNPIPLNLSVL